MHKQHKQQNRNFAHAAHHYRFTPLSPFAGSSSAPLASLHKQQKRVRSRHRVALSSSSWAARRASDGSGGDGEPFRVEPLALTRARGASAERPSSPPPPAGGGGDDGRSADAPRARVSASGSTRNGSPSPPEPSEALRAAQELEERATRCRDRTRFCCLCRLAKGAELEPAKGDSGVKR